MVKKLNEWRAHIESALKENKSNNALLLKHRARIDFFSHERMVHLLVTLAVGNFLLISAISALFFMIPAFYAISVIFLILFVFYIIHYFRLENGVQDLYRLY